MVKSDRDLPSTVKSPHRRSCHTMSSQKDLLRPCPNSLSTKSLIFYRIAVIGAPPHHDHHSVSVEEFEMRLRPIGTFLTPTEDSLPQIDTVNDIKTMIADGSCTEAKRAIDLGKNMDNL
ncbi:hypothetical protein LOK49_Contig578G00002 [Camellia lanceoleosa]|nr:hypothetical protein LOK49_Contig578G00002 [Camellia lanceoleosa]